MSFQASPGGRPIGQGGLQAIQGGGEGGLGREEIAEIGGGLGAPARIGQGLALPVKVEIQGGLGHCQVLGADRGLAGRPIVNAVRGLEAAGGQLELQAKSVQVFLVDLGADVSGQARGLAGFAFS